MLVKRSDLAWTLNEIAKDGREAFIQDQSQKNC